MSSCCFVRNFGGGLIPVVICLIYSPIMPAEENGRSLWNLKRLNRPPVVEPADSYGAKDIHSVFYAGEPWKGKPTKVYAYYGFPEGASDSARVPGVVCIHG